MRKIIFALSFILAFCFSSVSQTRAIHILSVNDMHANIDNFPQLSAIVDSLRAIDPQLLVLSAGDNRTGNPVNDQYVPASYPIVSLMNFVGFNCSALGNHEFDSHLNGLAKVIDLSNFPYLCANAHPDSSLGIHSLPYLVLNVDSVSVGILSVVQLGSQGYPSTHPFNVRGISFSPVDETVRSYEWLTRKCDVNILLTHVGYDADLELASLFPYYDLIVGGHSHTQLNGGEFHNGVLITQNANNLNLATYTTLYLENGKVVRKEAENINVSSFPARNPVVAELVRFFNDNDFFKRILGQVVKPFRNTEELGVFMCDALRSESNADFVVMNVGGVRLDSLPVGDVSVKTVLRLDPFDNQCFKSRMTGRELYDLMLSVFRNDKCRFPYTSSNLRSVVVLDSADPSRIKKFELLDSNGRKLDMNKVYTVAASSYVVATNDAPHKDLGTDTGVQTSSMIMSYIEKNHDVGPSVLSCQQISLSK